MIIKNITEKQISETGTILPFKKNIFPNKTDKIFTLVSHFCQNTESIM